VSGASVAIREAASSSGLPDSAKSDARGTFTLRRIPTGSYVVDVECGGMWGEAVVTVADDDPPPVIVSTRPRVEIHGRVVASEPGVEQELADHNFDFGVDKIPYNFRAYYGARPGSAGFIPIDSFDFRNINPDGTFTMPAVRQGRYMLSTYFPDRWYLGSATADGVDVSAEPFEVGPEGVKDLTIRPTQKATQVFGRVTPGAEHPVAVAFTTDRTRWTVGPWPTSVVVEAVRDGRCTFVDLPAGNYYIAAMDAALFTRGPNALKFPVLVQARELLGRDSQAGSDYETVTPDASLLATLTGTATKVTITRGVSVTVAVPLARFDPPGPEQLPPPPPEPHERRRPAGGSIEGTVTDDLGRPVPHLQIEVAQRLSDNPLSFRWLNRYYVTDPRGHYVVDRLDAGDYLVGTELGLSSASTDQGTTVIETVSPASVSIARDELQAGIDLRLHLAPTASLSVDLPVGSTRATVCPWNRDLPLRRPVCAFVLDPQNHLVELNRVVAGHYSVGVREGLEGAVRYGLIEATSNGALPVRVQSDLSKAATISVRVQFIGSAPDATSWLNAIQLTRTSVDPGFGVFLPNPVGEKSNGNVLVWRDLVPGQYTLTSGGYTWRVVSVSRAGRDITAQPFAVELGHDPYEVVVTLEKRSAGSRPPQK
jgi:hypothetical protein